MNDLYFNIAIGGWIVTGLIGIYSANKRNEIARRLTIAMDQKVYWQHKALTSVARASQRGRYAQACKMEHTRAKVASRTAELRKELSL